MLSKGRKRRHLRSAIRIDGDKSLAPGITGALVVDHAVGGICPVKKGPAIKEVVA